MSDEQYYEELERRLKERKKPNKAGYSEYGIDEDKKIEYQYVNIANPIILGMKIGIGMFIVFPLFIIAIAIVMLLFGGVLASIFG